MLSLTAISKDAPRGFRDAARVTLILVTVFAGLGGLPGTTFADANKVLICHYPPGNPANRNILSVSANSLPAHVSHGDNVVGPETCDLVDNDCDGLVDENESGDPLTNPTTCGVGECAGNTGFETCENGVFVNDTCDPLDGSTPEVCDTLDNDCDGPVDEDGSGNPLTRGTTCGVGECSGNTGIETCSGGVYAGDTCDPLDGAAPEACDGQDNDCDGSTDENGASLCDDGVSCTDDACTAGSCSNPPGSSCDVWEVCDPILDCQTDPLLTCPCDADLDLADWDNGSIPFGGCITNAGDGFPQYGLVLQVGGPQPDGYNVSFILDSGDNEPDGIRDYTCVVGVDDDGIDGDPPIWSPVFPVVGAEERLGCAVRMNSGAPLNVLACIEP